MTAIALPAALELPPLSFPKPSPSVRELIFDLNQFQAFQNVAEAFFYNAAANPRAIAFDQAQDAPEGTPRPYRTSTHAESRQRVLAAAAWLDSLGVEPGDHVAILSFERPEWTEAEMALFTVGAVVIPAYVRDNDERLEYILRDSGATYAFAENQEQVEKLLRRCTAERISLKKIISFEEASLPTSAHERKDLLVSWQEIIQRQPSVGEEAFAWRKTRREDLAQIGYTSGSSGIPKGVPVTHGQILTNLWQMVQAGLVDYDRFVDPRRKLLQPFVTHFLPERAHAYPGRVAELAATTPVRSRFPAIVDRRHSRIDHAFRESLRRDIREGAAGIVPVVPKLLITIVQRVKERLECGNFVGRWIGKLISAAAQRLLREARGERRRASDVLSKVADPLRKAIARRIRSVILGPDFGFFVAGGAKLPQEVGAYLWALEIPVYEGYGTTETNCAVATGVPGRYRIGSPSRLFDGVEAKVDGETGELLIRGPNVATSYWNNPVETARSWTDGWYHTRDIGRLDETGYLYISDRIDNILVLQNGENVSASEIECRFADIPYIETAIVLGHQRQGLIALVVLNEDAVRRWAERTGRTLAMPLKSDPAIQELVEREMQEKVNSRVRRCFDQVRALAIIDPLGTHEKTLTATEKPNRRMIEEQHAPLIEKLYAGSHKWRYNEPASTST